MESFVSKLNSPYTWITGELAASMLIPRKPVSHKGDYGHALLIAGNTGKMGAALLAAKACLRSGTGLLTLSVPENTAAIVHTALPEAMVLPRSKILADLEKFTVAGIGPGLGTEKETEELLAGLLQHCKLPMVLDADALNILSMNPGWLKQLPAGSVLTPHPKEFDRLFGLSSDDAERAQKALTAAEQYHLVILVKGHHTLVAANGKAFVNTSGNAGMAKGGTGDVLTGMITAFIAQGYPAKEAALLGVYLHGLAADLALDHQSMESMLASDIIEKIGAAFNGLHKG